MFVNVNLDPTAPPEPLFSVRSTTDGAWKTLTRRELLARLERGEVLTVAPVGQAAQSGGAKYVTK